VSIYVCTNAASPDEPAQREQNAYDSNDGNDNTVLPKKVAEIAMPTTLIALEARALNTRTVNTDRGPGSYPRLFCAQFFGQEQQGNMLSAPPLRM
jgi:hypothetical protein